MILRLHSIAIRYDADPKYELPIVIAKRLGNHASSMKNYRIIKRSIDARNRPVKLLFGVDVEIGDGPAPKIAGATEPPDMAPSRINTGAQSMQQGPIIVGGGPAGLFAAWLLAKHGYAPLVIDRGGDVAERVKTLESFAQTRVPDPECNALFGLGGAGTFSDGKLTTGVRHPWLASVLQLMVDCGAPKNIMIDAKPHVGTDVLRQVITNLVKKIQDAGGTVKTGVRMDELICKNNEITGIKTSNGPIDTQALILAIGHSARDTWTALSNNGVALEPKPFQMGIRAEHPQQWVDHARYGIAAGHTSLGAADYKLATKIGSTPVFSFCMCPGGETMPTVNEAGHLAVNGMSYHARDGEFSSSALVVTLLPEVYGGKDLASCLEFVRSVEKRCFEAGGGNYCAPAQRLIDFANGQKSNNLPNGAYRFGTQVSRLDKIMPSIVAQPLQKALPNFNRNLRGYMHPEAIVLGPESRASSPIRIVRDRQTLESPTVSGVYPVGEGAGYAGGIMSSALDGLNAASKIIERYAPL